MEENLASTSKVTPPDIPEVITRQRLFDMLDHVGHCHVTWISATAGSGKTTFAANYLAKHSIPCLWYQMDERDGDIPTFFYYLRMAAQRALPQMETALPLLTQDKHENPVLFAQNYFEDLSRYVPSPFVMVFDNYQLIDPGSHFHAVFQKGIRKVSPAVHVLILSRTDPPPEFAGMLANNEMQLIGPESFLLTPEETAAILEKETNLHPNKDMVDKIHQKTQGWAAGLILVAKYIHREKIPPEGWDMYLPTVVYDYFAGEFFNSMDDGTKEFLLVSSFLPVMTDSAVQSLTHHARAGGILLELYRNHMFIERFSALETTYQYHPLFREFLLAKANQSFDAQKIFNLRQSAALQMEAIKRVEDAADIYAEINDAEALARLVQTQALPLINQGRLDILQNWIKKIPEEKQSENPWLSFWMGMSFSPGQAQQAIACFKTAFHRFLQKKEWIGVYLSWSRIVDSIILAWDNFKDLDEWIEWFDQHPPSKNAVLPEEITARLTGSFMGALIIRKPDHPELAHWLDRALDLSRKISDNTTRLKIGIWAVTYFMWIGEFDKASIFRDKADNSMRQGTVSPVTRMFWQWLDISADIRFMNTPEKALARVMDLLEEADQKGTHQTDQMLFPPGVFAALVLGDFKKAKILLDRFSALPDDDHFHGLVIFHHFQGLYCMLHGHMSEAMAHADTALKMADKTGYVFYQALCHFQMAHIQHGMEMPEASQDHLNIAYDLSVKTKSSILRYMCLLKQAHLKLDHTRNSERAEGLEILSEAMALGRSHDFVVTVWWWDPDMMVALCGEALRAGIETDFVQRMITAHRLCPQKEQHLIEEWPWPVKIHVLGSFRIQVEGKDLQFKGKSPKKPLELLQVLIANGGENVPMEKVMDALWYDAEGDIAQSAFSTTLNRLRTLLKNKNSVGIINGKISLNPECCWVDMQVFNRIMDEGDGHWEQGDRKKAARLYKTALAFYANDFLSEEPAQTWNIAVRERTKNRYLNGMIRQGLWLEEAKQYKKAITLYEKGLLVDDLEEALYQRLMTCQLALGRTSDVVKTYQKCQKRLADTFGVAPSAETDALYRQIYS